MKQEEKYFEIAKWITDFLGGKITSEESEKLEDWINESEQHRQIWLRLTNPVYLEDHLHYWENRNTPKYWKQLTTELEEEPQQKKRKLRGRRSVAMKKAWQYAAAILPIILLSGAIWYFYHHNPVENVKPVVSPLSAVHIMPKGNVAQLVLGNGAVVNLSDSLQETITEKDGTKVHNHGGALSYVSSSGAEQKTVYNTLIVPRGGEYRIILPDGTRAWLNAASSLRYPTQFNGKERKVYLDGEGYFEVAENAKEPFVVHAGNTDVTVLGTRFDVSSYRNDALQKVVLAEGAVRVNAGNKDVLLKPGLGAFIQKDENISVSRVNVDAVLGWKNGMFIFDGESLGSIMKKMERWYNVQVQYEDGVNSKFHFTGRIKRFENITGLLNLIELTGKVKFGVVGNEVVVSPVE